MPNDCGFDRKSMEKYGKVWKYTCCATDSRHLFAYFTDYIVMAYGRTGWKRRTEGGI